MEKVVSMLEQLLGKDSIKELFVDIQCHNCAANLFKYDLADYDIEDGEITLYSNLNGIQPEITFEYDQEIKEYKDYDTIYYQIGENLCLGFR